MGSPKNAENRCILFSIVTPWRCYGVPTAIVAFLRRFHGVLSRSCGVLVGDRLRANGVLTTCPRRATACTPRFRSGHGACTTSTPRWRRPINSSPFCCGWSGSPGRLFMLRGPTCLTTLVDLRCHQYSENGWQVWGEAFTPKSPFEVSKKQG